MKNLYDASVPGRDVAEQFSVQRREGLVTIRILLELTEYRVLYYEYSTEGDTKSFVVSPQLKIVIDKRQVI